jgi:hypothetical protein
MSKVLIAYGMTLDEIQRLYLMVTKEEWEKDKGTLTYQLTPELLARIQKDAGMETTLETIAAEKKKGDPKMIARLLEMQMERWLRGVTGSEDERLTALAVEEESEEEPMDADEVASALETLTDVRAATLNPMLQET